MEDDDDDDDVIEQERSQKAAQFGWFNDLYIFDTGKSLSLAGFSLAGLMISMYLTQVSPSVWLV